jgi:hypothetical protein
MPTATLRQETHRLCSTISIPVTANLAQALPYLQAETEERVLWIDAICINQRDTAERGQQVGRMAEIFKMATQVVVWLGPADGHTSLAIKTLVRLAAEVEVNFVTEEVSRAKNAGPMSFLGIRETEAGYLLSLFERPWFERLWIWQEVHANPDETIVLIGEHSVPWSTVRKFLISVYLRPCHMNARQVSLLERARALSYVPANVDLVTLLLTTQDSQCVDAPDRVFALLGMLEPNRRLGIKADYTKTVTDVFKQVVLQYLSVFNGLKVLRHCKLVPEIIDTPSWVPSWSKGSTYSILNSWASLYANAVADYDGESTLRVLAVEVDTIASIQPPGCFAKGGRHVISWENFVSRTFSLLSASETAAGLSSSIEVIMRTLCWNSFADIYEPPELNLPSSSEVKDSLLRCGQYSPITKMHPDWCEPTRSLVLRTHVQRIAAEYSSFHAIKGQLGLAPKLATPGDKVCVILGCDTPLVLRLVSENQWCIVGDCYVHDIMDGGALLSSLPDEFQAIERMNPRTGSYRMAFKNMRTGHVQIEDPRLTEPLPAGWEMVKHDEEEYYQIFFNKEQSWYTFEDPRLTADALRARGVKLKNFNLV